MTNEKKAKEICDCDNCKACIKFAEGRNYALNSTCDIYEKVTQAMEWKDEQMKEALNNILIECDACFDEQTTNTLESIIKHQISIL